MTLTEIRAAIAKELDTASKAEVSPVVALPMKRRWLPHGENPIFDDGLWHIHETAYERLPIAVVDRGDDHHPPSREHAEHVAKHIANAYMGYPAALRALMDLADLEDNEQQILSPISQVLARFADEIKEGA